MMPRIEGAGVTGSFLELQGAQNVMYEPRDGVPGINFVHGEKSGCQSQSLADVKKIDNL